MTAGEPSPSTADRALLRAIKAWGGGDFAAYSSRLSQAMARTGSEPFWARASRGASPTPPGPPCATITKLRLRPDFLRVHPSWFVRALKAESPAVRLAVAAHAPSPVGEALRRGLGIDHSALATDREPDAEALGWALALWAERLVGEVPGLDSDPPVVVALTRLSPRELARLIKACGVAKLAFTIEGHGPKGFDESIVRFTPLDRVRFGFFRRQIGVADPRLPPLARLDLQMIEGDRRRGLARLGLVTFGRLLAPVEPHRARWALQHIPYPIAKLMRKKESPTISSKSLLAWESWVLEASWTRLLSEGWLAGGWTSRAVDEAGALR